MNIRGQSTLELTVALIVVLMLLVAAIRIFMWINYRMVSRQIYYENTRVDATKNTSLGVYNEPAYPELNIIGALD